MNENLLQDHNAGISFIELPYLREEGQIKLKNVLYFDFPVKIHFVKYHFLSHNIVLKRMKISLQLYTQSAFVNQNVQGSKILKV